LSSSLFKMPNAEKLAKKQKYFDKLVDLCINSPAALIVGLDHVASKQMQHIRGDLRGKAVVLCGKNTMIRKALSMGHEKYPEAGLEKLRAACVGNQGFIFATNCQLDDIRAVLKVRVMEAAAKQGQLSAVNLSIPSGPTGMDPSQTSFFQTLNIPTKIVKGQIELVSDFSVLKDGEKVSAGAAVLLTKLGFKPFSYGMVVNLVFQDASVFDAAVLDINESVLIQKFMGGVCNVAALGRELGIPTEAGLPHMFGNAFRNVAALIADADFSFKEVEEVKKFLENPDAYAAANPVVAASGGGGAAKGGGGAAKAPVAAAAEEEEDEGFDCDLFG